MDQNDLNNIFTRLDAELKRRRMHFKANAFCLVSIDKKGICLFKHMETGLALRFDCLKNTVVDWS